LLLGSGVGILKEGDLGGQTFGRTHVENWPIIYESEPDIVFVLLRVPVSSLLGTKALRPAKHSLEINCVKKLSLAGKTFLVTGSEGWS
jgi:hypothetical protein